MKKKPMTSLLKALAVTGTVGFSGFTLADCTQPDMPEMPEGGKASMEQMLEGQKSMKAFQAENADYMTCLEQKFTAAEKTVKDGADEDKAEALKAYESGIKAYNDAVNAEKGMAEDFNAQVRAYKEANPG